MNCATLRLNSASACSRSRGTTSACTALVRTMLVLNLFFFAIFVSFLPFVGMAFLVNSLDVFCGQVRVKHGCREVGMAQQFLNRAQVGTPRNQVTSEGPSKCMRVDTSKLCSVRKPMQDLADCLRCVRPRRHGMVAGDFRRQALKYLSRLLSCRNVGHFPNDDIVLGAVDVEVAVPR